MSFKQLLLLFKQLYNYWLQRAVLCTRDLVSDSVSSPYFNGHKCSRTQVRRDVEPLAQLCIGNVCLIIHNSVYEQLFNVKEQLLILIIW